MESSNNSNERVVLTIISEELDVDVDQLAPSVSLIDDLHADSLALINIVMKLEEKFHIDLPDAEWRKLRTIGDVVSYVRRLSVAPAAAGTAEC